MRETLDSKLQFRPDLVTHVISDREVVLLGEREEYVLEGQSIATLAPLLDGTRTEDEVVEAVSDRIDPADAYFALAELQCRGYVQPAVSERGETWSGFSAELANALSGESAASPRFASYGLEPKTSSLINSVLEGSRGMLVKPISILAVDDYLRPELSQAVKDAQECGSTLLPMRIAGAKVWFGPVVDPSADLNWSTFLKRHAGVRASDVSVLNATNAFPLRSNKTPVEIAQVAACLAVQFAVRLSVGEKLEVILGSIWEMDMQSMQTEQHLLPQENYDIGPKATVLGHEPVLLQECKKVFRAEGGHRACSPDQTLLRLLPNVDSVCGVVPALIRGEAEDDLYHYQARQNLLGNTIRHSENRLLGRPQSAEGKGQTDTQAKVSCLGEAIERYSCCVTDDIETRLASFNDIEDVAVHPNSVQLFSDNQFSDREIINKDAGLFNMIPERFDPSVDISWTGLWSLTNQTTRWLPTGMCYYHYDASEGGKAPRFATCNSNGCASGNTLEEAILQGLLELIERDAVALWWYNRLRRASVDLNLFSDTFFEDAQTMCSNRNRTLEVIDLTNDLGIPVFVAISARNKDRGFVCLGFGCHLEPRLAISRAITEMFQMLSRDNSFDKPQDISNDPDFIDWFETASLDTDPYLIGKSSEKLGPFTYADQSTNDVAKDVQLCVELLAKHGLDTLVLNQTRPDVGFPTARVVVPGLRHFWTRFAPGRLYEVPVKQGWQNAALTEASLNPRKFIW